MQKKDSKSVIRKYYLSCFFVLLLYVAIITPIIWFYHSFWSIVCCALLYLPVKVLIRIIANETIASVLFKDLDAFEFQKIITDKHFIPPLAYRINAAITTGDYQTIVNTATKQMQKKNCSVMAKHSYLYLLSRVYFELRDYEKLKIVVAKHEELRKRHPNKSFLRTSNSMWSYYCYFLEQNYKACKTVCIERNLQLKPKAWDTKIGTLQNDFYYAVACYENGELDLAKSSFIAIASAAPKMHLSAISKKYLEAIEQNEHPPFFDTDVFLDDSFQIHDQKTQRIKKRHRFVLWFATVFVIILLLIKTGLEYYEQKEFKSELLLYENKLNDALTKQYNKSSWICHLGLKKNDAYVDSLCLANNNGNLSLMNIVSYDDDQTFEVLEIVEILVCDSYYCVKSLASDYYIGFTVSSNAPPSDSLYYSFEFEHKNNTYWFYIDYVETTPKTEF